MRIQYQEAFKTLIASYIKHQDDLEGEPDGQVMLVAKASGLHGKGRCTWRTYKFKGFLYRLAPNDVWKPDPEARKVMGLDPQAILHQPGTTFKGFHIWLIDTFVTDRGGINDMKAKCENP